VAKSTLGRPSPQEKVRCLGRGQAAKGAVEERGVSRGGPGQRVSPRKELELGYRKDYTFFRKYQGGRGRPKEKPRNIKAKRETVCLREGTSLLGFVKQKEEKKGDLASGAVEGEMHFSLKRKKKDEKSLATCNW